ncbi:MAG: hypothetical protein INR65_19355 [Gluconacetobacter diazotrophicus]|nr:hypothetical protein [Gluconacetobacter diazotrophicus]
MIAPRVAILACIGVLSLGLPARAAPAPAANLADDPRYHRKDPNETVITDIAAWSHPTKAVFARHHLELGKVELMWDRTFPVFHVATLGADPATGPGGRSLTALELELLRANGFHAYKLVEDDHHDGVVIAYDQRTRTVDREVVQDEPT